MKHILMACLLTVTLATAGSVARAADGGAGGSASAAQPVKKAKYMPFRGKVVNLDTRARTLTLAGKTKSRTFKLIAETRVHNDGKQAELEDVRTGAMVGGRARATEDGGWEVLVLNLGIKPAKGKAQEKDVEVASDESME